MFNVSDPEILVVYNVTKNESSGWYTCLVSNSYGREYKSAWLEVVGKYRYSVGVFVA